MWINSSNPAAAAAAKSLQSGPTLCNPIDGSPPGSAIPGILQARTLEWVAIPFSNQVTLVDIILFHAQIVLPVVSGSPSKLTSERYWHEPVNLRLLPGFQAQQDALRLTLYNFCPGPEWTFNPMSFVFFW